MTVEVGLHQSSASMLWQVHDDASDSILIENNGVSPDWGCNPFSSDTIVFNEMKIAVVAALTLPLKNKSNVIALFAFRFVFFARVGRAFRFYYRIDESHGAVPVSAAAGDECNKRPWQPRYVPRESRLGPRRQGTYTRNFPMWVGHKLTGRRVEVLPSTHWIDFVIKWNKFFF